MHNTSFAYQTFKGSGDVLETDGPEMRDFFAERLVRSDKLISSVQIRKTVVGGCHAFLRCTHGNTMVSRQHQCHLLICLVNKELETEVCSAVRWDGVWRLRPEETHSGKCTQTRSQI